MKKITLLTFFCLSAFFIEAQTITQTVITSAVLTIDGSGTCTAWSPTPSGNVTITITGDTANANSSVTVFNQFKITDASGAQWAGGGKAIALDANGDGSVSWAPGFFGGAIFNGSENTGFWRSNYGSIEATQTFPITQNSLSTKEFSKNKLHAFYNADKEAVVMKDRLFDGGYSIYNLMGQEVLEGEITNEISVKTLKTGIYILSTEFGSLKFAK